MIPKEGRFAHLPEEAILPVSQVFGFVDEGHEARENAHTVEDFIVGSARIVGIDEGVLQELEAGDEDVDEGFEVLVRIDLLVRPRMVVFVVQSKTAYVVGRP